MVARSIKWLATTSLLSLLALAACESKDDVTPAAPVALDRGLTAQQFYVRASLDVRGVRPTSAELTQLAANPMQLDGMLAALVDDPRFGNRVREIFAPALRTRRDQYRFGTSDYGLPEDQEVVLQRAYAEETLNIMHYVAVADHPFSEVLTADYTIVDPILLSLWPLAADAAQPDGLPENTRYAHYTDGRPAAGVLATNSFYWRHTSTVQNANRGRTNAISRAFLCEDYLDRPIDFPKDVDLTDSEGIAQAISTNPGCQACHATLDPFAAHLWGFMQLSDDTANWSRYHPENELLWAEEVGAAPAYFGTPTSGSLTNLSQAIAADERFVACTTRRIYEAFLGRPATLADEGQLAQHREAFLASELSIKALVRSLLTDPAYRGQTRVSRFGGSPAPVALKLVSPALLSTSLADLSGYHMTLAGRELTAVDYGLRALAGGSERGPSASPSLGRAMVMRRLAEGSAMALVAQAGGGSRVQLLLQGSDMSAKPDAATVAAVVYEVQSVAVDTSSDEVQTLLSLWDAVAAEEDAKTAWTAMLTAIFADPSLAVY